MKATGPDSIPAFILKVATDKLAQILTRFFQLSLDTGVVTMDWKHARVVPIFTKGQKHLAANYRPVSFTSITRTILEHKVHSCIMIHFDTNNILTDTKHGFKRKRSCGTKLIITIHQIAKELADGSQVDANLLDFRKAIDKVLHACLMQRLDYYGVRGNVHNWI